MLKIIGTTDGRQASIEFDRHIPFSLRLGVPPAESSFIWTCNDRESEGKVSTLEVWVHARTGAIHEITLVTILPSRVILTEDFDGGPTVPTPGRIPVCDTEPWMREKAWNNPEEPAKKYVDDARRFDFVVGVDFVSVRFPGLGEPQSWIVNQRSRFGMNAEGFLCRIDLIGLKADELAGIREAATP